MNVDAVIEMVASEMRKLGSQRALAKSIGTEEATLSRIRSGKQDPTTVVLEYFGLERVTEYEYKRVGVENE